MDSLAPTIDTTTHSGLVDMRALAAAHAAPARTSTTTMDVVLGAFAPVAPLGSPLAVRIDPPRRDRARALVLAFGVGAVLAAAALVQASSDPTATSPVTSPVKSPIAAPALPSEPAPAVTAPAITEPTPVAEPAVVTPRARRPRAASSPSASTAPDAALAVPSGGLDRSLDDLLAGATAPATTTPAAPEPSLRRAPTRDEVRSAMAALAPAITACAAGEHGLASTAITFDGATGRARSALVNGDFAGTAAGSCMARALRGASLEPFAQETFTVQFPFAL